ncbi:MAG: 4-hydroxy-3-methylbut-2-enyl diphosphate reductase [Opitutaceae bacterium]
MPPNSPSPKPLELADPPAGSAAPAALECILAFNASNHLAIRRLGLLAELPFTGSDPSLAIERLEGVFARHTAPREQFSFEADGRRYRVGFTQVLSPTTDPEIEFRSIEQLESGLDHLSPSLAAIVARLEDHLTEIPYLHIDESDFIYKFRPERERNASIYALDADANALYQSRLFSAIKILARHHERSAAAPVELDFGAVRYIVPSHFGFCLGVKNAIERAYETLAENPGRRVFMVSELIHNPFVNQDLLRRGLRYLQTDKGVPYAVDGRPAPDAPGVRLRWDDLTPEDIVIIPAFGATDEDKKRLVRKGLAVTRYDATCMLVEKVWKAARAYGREGYTVVIHGKHEHEETKATFANTRRYAPAVIVRNIEEARLLGEMIASDDPEVRKRFYTVFAGKHTPGFDADRDLRRIAVVNQTTLLVNETRKIVEYFRNLYATRRGPDRPGEPSRVGGSGRTDTLCYATQVNQDALARALAEPLDVAFVIGGRNSSNTYQLYRLCARQLGERAFFIESEASIRSAAEVEHCVFPAKPGGIHRGHAELRPLWPGQSPLGAKRILITGGASCPDGIIQQVINRINTFFPPDRLKPAETVLEEIRASSSE